MKIAQIYTKNLKHRKKFARYILLTGKKHLPSLYLLAALEESIDQFLTPQLNHKDFEAILNLSWTFHERVLVKIACEFFPQRKGLQLDNFSIWNINDYGLAGVVNEGLKMHLSEHQLQPEHDEFYWAERTSAKLYP